MRTISKNLVDRLQSALAAQGVAVSRTKALVATSAAFGYRTSNEFTAAAQAGELDPPKPSFGYAWPTSGTPGAPAMVVTMDPIAKLPFGVMNPGPLTVSPYGNLVDTSTVLSDGTAEASREIRTAIEAEEARVQRKIDEDGPNWPHIAALADWPASMERAIKAQMANDHIELSYADLEETDVPAPAAPQHGTSMGDLCLAIKRTRSSCFVGIKVEPGSDDKNQLGSLLLDEYGQDQIMETNEAFVRFAKPEDAIGYFLYLNKRFYSHCEWMRSMAVELHVEEAPTFRFESHEF